MVGLVVSSRAQLAYHSTKFTQKDGLPSYNVKNIAQDKSGFIWIGTQDGLYFYNGNNFNSLYNKASANATKDVKQIAYDSINNWMWVAYSAGGLEAFDCNDLTLKKSIWAQYRNKVRPIENIHSFFITERHQVFVVLTDGLSTFVPNPQDSSINLVINEKDTSSLFLNLYQYKGVVAIIKNKGLFVYDCGRNITGQCLLAYPAQNQVSYLDSHSFYYFSNNKVIKYDLMTKKKTEIETNLNVTCINRWYTNGILLSTDKGNYMADFRSGRIQSIDFYNDGNPEEKDYVITSMWDKHGNLWLGNSKSLQFSAMQQPFLLPFSNKTPSLSSINHLYQIASFSKNELLLGDLSGCYSLKSSSSGLKSVVKGGPTYQLSRYKKDSLFYDAGQQLFFLTKQKGDYVTTPVEQLFPEWKLLSKNDYTSMVMLSDDSLVFANAKAFIVLWDKKNRTCRRIDVDVKNGYLDDNIFSITRIDASSVLICQQNGIVVCNITTGAVQPIGISHPTTHEKITYFFDALLVENQIWIATYGYGIIIVDRHFNIVNMMNVKNGLTNNGVYKLLNDGIGNVWASTNNGLNRMPINGGKISTYYTEDGLHNNMFEQYCGSQFGENLYFGGINGFTAVNPKSIIKNQIKPKVFLGYIEFVYNDKTEVITDIDRTAFSIPRNAVQTNLILISNNLGRKGKNIFYYRIKGRSNDWISLGTESKISIMGLSPGNYNIVIKTVNTENDLWDEKEVLFKVTPKWFETVWFKAILVLAAFGSVFALYSFRIRQLKVKHEIRKKIAADLHDDLGSTLNSVKIYANLALQGDKPHENLLQVKSNVDSATTALRDLIWVLDDTKDLVDDLILRIKQYVVPITKASKIDATISFNPEIINFILKKSDKRSLFLITKEAVNNVVKHADATEISIVIALKSSRVKISITDNGKGFNEGVVNKGYGLNNMKYRAKEIGYSIKLVSRQNAGTEISIEPL